MPGEPPDSRGETRRLVCVGDGAVAERLGARDGVEAVSVDRSGVLARTLADADGCVLADDPPSGMRSALASAPVPVVAYAGAPTESLGAVADGFVRRTDDAEGDLDRVLDAVAWETTAGGDEQRASVRRQQVVERLHDIVAEMVACDSESDLYDLLVAAAESVLDFSVCVVMVDDGDGLVVRAGSDADLAPPAGTRFAYEGSAAGETFRTGEPRLDEDIPASEAGDPHDERYRSAVSVPLGDAGVVQAISTAPNAFDEHDREMAELLASQAGAVLTRLRAQSRLRTERDRFRSLFEHVPDPAVRFTLADDTPTVLDVNPAFEDVFGYEAAELAGENLDEFVVPDDARSAAAGLNDRLRSGESFRTEVRRQTATGEYRDFIGHAVPTERSAGNVVGFVVYTDITDRKHRERRLDGLHRTTRELLGATDADAVCEIAVSAAREILGLPVTAVYRARGDELRLAAASASAWAQFDGAPPVFLAGDDVWAAYEAGRSRLLRDVDGLVGETPVEELLVFPLGEYGVVVSGSPADRPFDEGTRDLAGVLAANVEAALARAERERRLRRRERELDRQNERLESFASVVSHDLRTPLSVARGHLDIARQEGDSDALRSVAEAHERMDALIDDLLTLAQEGRVVGRTETVDLESAARDAWYRIGAVDASLSVRETMPVEADRDRLLQLLENLFRNSVEHGSTDRQTARPPDDAVERGSPDGEDAVDSDDAIAEERPAVSVTVAPLDGDASRGFYVADDGPGIPEADRERVFDRGFTTAEHGTGFGLAIVSDIADAHGWSVAVTESRTGGARVEIRTD